MSSTETVTITEADVKRLAEKIDAAGLFEGQDRTMLEGIFYLAGQAVADDEPEVEGFMPAYMKLGDIKGEAQALPAVQLNLSVLGTGLQGAYRGGAGKVQFQDLH